jgi:hypothetical protein
MNFCNDFYLGVDLAQAHDFTAFAGVQRVDQPDGSYRYRVGQLVQLERGLSYTQIVSIVLGQLTRYPSGTQLVVDGSGVGRAVVDLFREAGAPNLVPVTIVAGDVASREDGYHRVGKNRLISTAQAIIHQGRLHIDKNIPDADKLVAEMQAYRLEYTPSGLSFTYNARSGKHDDLVLAMCLALWRAYGGNMAGQGIYEYHRRRALGIPIGPARITPGHPDCQGGETEWVNGPLARPTFAKGSVEWQKQQEACDEFPTRASESARSNQK